MPNYRVIADASGSATAEALATELRLPISDRVTGESEFSARLLFPRGNIEDPSPFTIQIASDLRGFVVDLPQPLGKAADQAVDFGASIFLPKGGELVETTGVAGDVFSWQVAITKQDEQWDIDRGLVTFGVNAEVESIPETRGLHLRGNTDYVNVRRWFEQARKSESKMGMVERVRTVDLTGRQFASYSANIWWTTAYSWKEAHATGTYRLTEMMSLQRRSFHTTSIQGARSSLRQNGLCCLATKQKPRCHRHR